MPRKDHTLIMRCGPATMGGCKYLHALFSRRAKTFCHSRRLRSGITSLSLARATEPRFLVLNVPASVGFSSTSAYSCRNRDTHLTSFTVVGVWSKYPYTSWCLASRPCPVNTPRPHPNLSYMSCA